MPLIDRVLTSEKLKNRANKMAQEISCNESLSAKKGKFVPSVSVADLSFIAFISDKVSPKKRKEIECYMVKRYSA